MMNASADRIAVLLVKLLQQQASEAEKAELDIWKNESPEHAAIVNEALEPEFIRKGLQELEAAQQKMDQILRDRGVPLPQKDPEEVPAVRRIPLVKRACYAAAVLLLVALGAYWYTTATKSSPVRSSNAALVAGDILPGSNRATLQLTGGRVLILDSLIHGIIARQGNVTIQNSQGQLAYRTAVHPPFLTGYNTITTPRGGQYRLLLSDGTRVWLNAASSLVYPVSFAVDQRSVTLVGEAYFEVAHLTTADGQSVPFQVKINDSTRVDVLGTHFTIQAYPDEGQINTTLLEGRVAIRSVVLHPGQQAQVNPKGGIRLLPHVDTAEAVAWKDGFFYFKHAAIPTIMRQISRWYDLEVDYEGAIPRKEFTAKMPRNIPLSQVLAILTASDIRYRLKNRKLTILP